MQTTTQKPDPSTKPDSESALYLVVDMRDPGDLSAISDRLSKALKVLPVSAVLLANQDAAPESNDALQALITTIQRQDIAAMVSNDPKLARSLAADGVHLHWRASITADYEAQRAVGGGAMMIGADAGKSRHDAMVLAETNADYVAFGVPANLKDQDTARARQLELVTWWVYMFEIPVVAFDITTPEQAAAVKAVGADFVAATLPPNSTDQAQFEAWLTAFADLFPPTQTNA